MFITPGDDNFLFPNHPFSPLWYNHLKDLLLQHCSLLSSLPCSPGFSIDRLHGAITESIAALFELDLVNLGQETQRAAGATHTFQKMWTSVSSSNIVQQA